MSRPIKAKERETIIQSLKSGVVPRAGLQHIQVGRSEELKSFIKDVDTIADGGTSFRFVIGEYGSGKTFFLSLVRSIALEKGLVTMHADLSPTKRLHGSDGQPRMLLAEMINNLSTRTKPDGNALQNILERFISTAKEEANAKLQKGLCEFKLENNKFMFENEDDRYKVFVPDKFIKVNVGIEKKLLEHYLDGYKTIKIEDYKDENNCLLSGESSEMKKLMYALGRNCIRMY